MAPSFIATRLFCLLRILNQADSSAAQMPLLAVHCQDCADWRKGSCVQLELQGRRCVYETVPGGRCTIAKTCATPVICQPPSY